MKKLFVVGWIIMLSLTLSGLALAQAPQDPEKFKFGFLTPLSGPSAWLHGLWGPGATIAVEEINEQGGIAGKKMDIIMEDNKSADPKAGMSGMLKLVDMDKVPVVIVSFTPVNLAVQPISQEKKILQFNFGAWSPELVNKPYLFNTRLVGNILAEGVAKVAWDKGYRKVAILHPNDNSGNQTRDYIRPIWEKWGGKIVATETAELGASAFQVQLSKIRTAKPDCIFNYFYTTDLGYCLKQARELGMDQPQMGFLWSTAIAKAAGSKGAEIYSFVQDYFNPDSEKAWTKRFVAKYQQKTGKKPDMWGANGYETVYVIKYLIEEARKKGGNYYTGENLRAALLKVRSFDTIYEGSITFRDDGSCTKATAYYVIKDGKEQFVSKVDLK
jgi:branched-chain amino acid transport system substrate-binding protein